MGDITGTIDLPQVVLYVFWLFFAGLIFYLRREDRREGYPLFSEPSNTYHEPNFLLMPEPKSFLLVDGSTVQAPTGRGDDRILEARKVEPWPGAPLEPIGDPMSAGVGPGSYAERADVPDLMLDGSPRLQPLRAAPAFAVAERDRRALGMPVYGADRKLAGRVADMWVDRMEVLVRYLEVELEGAGDQGARQRVLLPVNFAKIDMYYGRVEVQAIMGGQFAGVPAIDATDRVTRLEEEKVTAYYGAGTLYAEPKRAEAWI